jgi:3-hydroxypropanoate dehydrogenase
MKINEQALKQLFSEARTHRAWKDKEVSDSILKEAYDLAKMGPTAANCLPLRVLFIKSTLAKERLKPFLDAGNVEKTMIAPVTAVIAYDLQFYERMGELYPMVDAKSWFIGNEKYAQETAFRNSSLQGAYFILAARACGLDCGPMSGFDNIKVDEEFFKNTSWRSNFLVNLGYGDSEKLHPRLPRLPFEDVSILI